MLCIQSRDLAGFGGTPARSLRVDGDLEPLARDGRRHLVRRVCHTIRVTSDALLLARPTGERYADICPSAL
jgi:hypothetical protein